VIESNPRGVVLTVWVVPSASRDGIVGRHGDALKVRTTAAATGGTANRAVADQLERALGADRIELLTGAAGRRKRYLVVGVEVDRVRSILESSPSA